MGRVSITPNKLAGAIKEELTIYHEDVNEGLINVTRKHMVNLVRKTRVTAPERTGDYKKSIAGDFKGLKRGNRKISATWYVKAPHYRLTHLLVRGHATKDGGRTKSDPFLENALAEELPEYEKDVKEVVQNGG